MEQQRKLLTPIDWSNKFDLPYSAITKSILPRFPNTTLEWANIQAKETPFYVCLLYTSPSPRDVEESRMPSSA